MQCGTTCKPNFEAVPERLSYNFICSKTFFKIDFLRLDTTFRFKYDDVNKGSISKYTNHYRGLHFLGRDNGRTHMSKVDIMGKEATFQHSKLVTNVINSIYNDIIGYEGMLQDDIISNGSQIFAGISIEELIKILIDAQPTTKLIGNAINNYTVDGPIIMAKVGNKTLSNLSQSIRIFYRSSSDKTNDRICVYWDKEVNKNRDGWSSAGCRHAGIIQGLHICECNHLTPLALLMPYFEDISDDHFFALSTISTIGCVLSMTSLLAVLLTFLTFKKWRQSLGNKILFNLCLALFFLLGSFILSGHLSRDPRLCKAVSLSTHYFLVSFTWMLVEAVYQYVTNVVVIGATSCGKQRL